MSGVKTLQPLAWTVFSIAAAEPCLENADPTMLDSCTAGTLLQVKRPEIFAHNDKGRSDQFHV